MGAARRRERREARLAAKKLVRSGVTAGDIERSVESSRIKRVLLKLVDGMEKRVDTGEGPVTVREGLAAIKALQEVEDREADRETSPGEIEADNARHADAEAALADDVQSREGTEVAGVARGAQHAPHMGETPMPRTAEPLRAAG